MRFSLVVVQGPDTPLKVDLPASGDLVIGRGTQAGLKINDDQASRLHTRITVYPFGLSVQDLGSTNGTFVNGRRVKEAELAPGDVVRFSSVIAQIMPEGSASSGAFEAAADATGRQSTAALREAEPASGEVPIILLDSLLWLLRRWDLAGGEALVALVEWLVARRGMRGAAIAEEVDGETMVRAAHGECTLILDDPRLGAAVRAASQHHEALESVQLRLGQHEVIMVHGAELPCLLILPGKAMPASSEIELYAALVRVAQRLVALPVPGRAGERNVGAS